MRPRYPRLNGRDRTLSRRYCRVTRKRPASTQTGSSYSHGIDHLADCVDYHLRLIDVDVVRAVCDFVAVLTGGEPSDEPAHRMPDEDVGTRHLGRGQKRLQIERARSRCNGQRHRIASAGLGSQRADAGDENNGRRTLSAAFEINLTMVADVNEAGKAAGRGDGLSRKCQSEKSGFT